jgi:hypothetical protein
MAVGLSGMAAHYEEIAYTAPQGVYLLHHASTPPPGLVPVATTCINESTSPRTNTSFTARVPFPIHQTAMTMPCARIDIDTCNGNDHVIVFEQSVWGAIHSHTPAKPERIIVNPHQCHRTTIANDHPTGIQRTQRWNVTLAPNVYSIHQQWLSAPRNHVWTHVSNTACGDVFTFPRGTVVMDARTDGSGWVRHVAQGTDVVFLPTRIAAAQWLMRAVMVLMIVSNTLLMTESWQWATAVNKNHI